MLEHCCRDCFHSATRALVMSGIDVERLGLTRSWRSNSLQRYSMWMRSGLCAGQSSSSTPISNYFCMDLALCMGALSCWKRKGPSLNCCHKVGSTESSRMLFYAVVLRCPHPPNCTVGTIHSGSKRSPGIHQTQIHPSDCQMVKRDSSLQSPMAVNFTPL
jgi:hypothetical protein